MVLKHVFYFTFLRPYQFDIYQAHLYCNDTSHFPMNSLIITAIDRPTRHHYRMCSAAILRQGCHVGKCAGDTEIAIWLAP